jgi:hypothetical protein
LLHLELGLRSNGPAKEQGLFRDNPWHGARDCLVVKARAMALGGLPKIQSVSRKFFRPTV